MTQETAELAGAATAEIIVRNTEWHWKVWSMKAATLSTDTSLMSYCVILAVSFISPRVIFGGRLPLEHPSGAPLDGSESISMGEQCFELMGVSLCCLRPPALLPGSVGKGYNELLSALVLVTTPCLLTLLKHLDSEKQSWWWDLKKLKLLCPMLVFYWYLCVLQPV